MFIGLIYQWLLTRGEILMSRILNATTHRFTNVNFVLDANIFFLFNQFKNKNGV